MRKTKITSFDKDGVRGGRSLEAVLSELGLECQTNGETIHDHHSSKTHTCNHPCSNMDSIDRNQEDEEEQILQICRLSFANPAKARAAGALIRSKRRWNKIVLEKTSGRCINHVLQDCVACTKILEIRQHQRYDGIKWNFGLEWFPNRSNSDGIKPPVFLEELRLTGVRFRGGDELVFLRSLADQGLATTKTNAPCTIGLKALELHSCRFLEPEVQYPILFRGLRAACGGTPQNAATLEKLWMPKANGLDDDRFQELFRSVLVANSSDTTEPSESASALRELGFSYNGCGWKGSQAVASYLETPRGQKLEVLYLNRQQGELDLEGILEAAKSANAGLHLNLSQNYAPSLANLQELRELAASGMASGIGGRVELEGMTLEVPEEALPGNKSHHTNQNNNRNKNNTGRRNITQASSSVLCQHNLSQEETAKLNVACGRVKYVLGRAAEASDRNVPKPSTQSNPSNSSHINQSNTTRASSDWYFSSMAALDCVLPDLLTILRLHEKQYPAKSSTPPQPAPQRAKRQQYQNWIPTFLRKAVRCKIQVLETWLVSIAQGNSSSSSALEPSDVGHGSRPQTTVTESERKRVQVLWDEIQALHASIAQHSQHRHEASEAEGDTSIPRHKKSSRRNKQNRRRGIPEVPMTPKDNPLVSAAYEEIPAIPTSILESPEGSFLSLPKTNPEHLEEANATEDVTGDYHSSIFPTPPIFIDTIKGLSRLRDDIFGHASIPRLIAVDSEWCFSEEDPSENAHPNTFGNHRKKTNKHRTMSVATLQIAYIDGTLLKSFVIDLLSEQPGFQELAKECVSWLFGSSSCETMILGFAFGGDLRQLRKYAGIGNYKTSSSSTELSSMKALESRCLDIQRLLASPEDVRNGRVPGLKKCAEAYFAKPLKKDDQTSDWKERPLRSSQLEYAALDAVILLVLLSQKKQEDETRAAFIGTSSILK